VKGCAIPGWNDGQVEIAARFAENEAARNRLLTNELLELKPIVVLLDPASPSRQLKGIVAVAVALNVTVEVMEVRSK
jgi:hypothetical protein